MNGTAKAVPAEDAKAAEKATTVGQFSRFQIVYNIVNGQNVVHGYKDLIMRSPYQSSESTYKGFGPLKCTDPQMIRDDVQ